MDQKLPNAQTVLILGIVSVVGSCCCTGLIGIICGLIGLNKYKSDKLLYDANPSQYSDFGNLNTGRILCIIGLILGILQVLYFIYILATIGWDGYMQQMQDLTKMGRG
ncbi:hypothetical protein SAMN05421841_0438 [Chryseobacterium wanjuense]|jgi:hypothetical protein|uniref:DUF4190 domain-containing protein n=1 Tax=Chryseobacterium wanjuense TaxID=356305 RepID=A0A1I0N8V0_9FLAO|nr:CCC motif membrane protein [Chryseobacterium wanjuense]SEV97407.1 hypothetical protein SAMN05421841_0438 [Chryseobacterium wanjuense]